VLRFGDHVLDVRRAPMTTTLYQARWHRIDPVQLLISWGGVLRSRDSRFPTAAWPFLPRE
jgi:hypothetical protein